MPDRIEQWARGGNHVLEAVHFTGRSVMPQWMPAATDRREELIAALGRPGHAAVLRQYRIPNSMTVHAGSRDARTVDTYEADLIVPLGDLEWGVLSAHVDEAATLAEFVPLLRSARRLEK